MKKVLFSVLLSFVINGLSFSQNQEIITSNLSKDALWANLTGWVSKSFNDYEAVVDSKDKEEGFITDYSVKDEGKFKVLEIVLKYDAKNKPIITKLERISKPGLRNYSKAKNLPKVLGGMGIAIVSTSKGLLTDRKARKENIGGEVLCYVY